MKRQIILSFWVVLLGIVLLGSTTNVQAVEEKQAETIICPVSHEVVEKAQAAGPVTYEGKDYYFCCSSCQAKFKAEPEKYANKAKDVVCGMTVDPAKAGKLVHKGKAYYFCNDKCKDAFEKNPDAMIKKAAAKDKYRAEEKATKAGCGNCEKPCCSDKTK